MSTVFTPVFSLSASAVHNVQHTVYDLSPSHPSTETAKTDSFNDQSILRVKELRADKIDGLVKATQIIVSNRPAISSGLVTKENLYEGQQDSKTAFNPADRNSAAFQVYSGGAWIGTGLGVNGNATVSGTGSFTGLLTASGGVNGSTGTFSGLLTANGGVTGTTGTFSGNVKMNSHPMMGRYGTAAGGTGNTDVKFVDYTTGFTRLGTSTFAEGRFTCQTKGIYVVHGSALTDTMASGTGKLEIKINGSSVSQFRFMIPIANLYTGMATGGVVSLSPGDYVEMWVQNAWRDRCGLYIAMLTAID